MGRSTRLRADFATQWTLPLIGSTIRVPRSSVASSVRRCSARKSRTALIQLARFDCVYGVQLYRISSRAFMSYSKVHRGALTHGGQLP